MKPKTISILIPVYNEEKFIIHTLSRVIEADTLDLKKEILIIDDCSSDGTYKLLKQEISRLKKEVKTPSYSITLIHKEVNEGKGAAIKKGLTESKGDIVIILTYVYVNDSKARNCTPKVVHVDAKNAIRDAKRTDEILTLLEAE